MSANANRRIWPLAAGICILAALLLGMFLWMRSAVTRSLPAYGNLPDFSLKDVRGRPFTRADLLGKVWVADLIYTRCPDTCPLQSAEMSRLQREFKGEPGLRFLSVTVDPGHDTADVLARYGASFGADPERWIFLTGEMKTIENLARKGFRLATGAQGALGRIRDAALAALSPGAARANGETAPPGPEGNLKTLISHSSRFVLLDSSTRLRGYYLSDDAQDLEELRRDIRVLLREGRR